MARPTKITETIIHDITQAVRSGNYIETAAQFAGIHKDTLYDWLKRGAREKQRVEKNPRNRIQEQERLFVEFSDALKEAWAEAEMNDVACIGTAADRGNWTAAAWRLERKFPDRWGRRKVEVSGPDGGPIQHEVTEPSEETKEEQFERLFAAINEYRADVDAPDGEADRAKPLDTDVPNPKAT